MSNQQTPSHILINQVKNIGDVVLCLPMAGLLKHYYPHAKITLLSLSYTHPVAQNSAHIDATLDWSQLQVQSDKDIIQQLKTQHFSHVIHIANNKRIAKLTYKAHIPHRIGTLQRFYHWLYCNHKINQARRRSPYHETELNTQLLKPLGINGPSKKQALIDYIDLKAPAVTLPTDIEKKINNTNFKLIIHPGSHGHAREWPEAHIKALVQQLHQQGITVFFTGTDKEEKRFRKLLSDCPQAHNLMGKMTLDELIAFIARCDGLVASSTGPMHIAAALNKPTLGLFPPKPGMSPTRWSPAGKKASVLVHQTHKSCLTCRTSIGCYCMKQIKVVSVLNTILQWQNNS